MHTYQTIQVCIKFLFANVSLLHRSQIKFLAIATIPKKDLSQKKLYTCNVCDKMFRPESNFT